jgi:hypothetical protein
LYQQFPAPGIPIKSATQGFHKVERFVKALGKRPSPSPFHASLEGEKRILGVSEVAEPLRIPQTPKKCKGLCENREKVINREEAKACHCEEAAWATSPKQPPRNDRPSLLRG